jgi:hypothetical protein
MRLLPSALPVYTTGVDESLAGGTTGGVVVVV